MANDARRLAKNWRVKNMVKFDINNISCSGRTSTTMASELDEWENLLELVAKHPETWPQVYERKRLKAQTKEGLIRCLWWCW